MAADFTNDGKMDIVYCTDGELMSVEQQGMLICVSLFCLLLGDYILLSSFVLFSLFCLFDPV